ncbi:MAG: DUF370 domain-containing protein [Clostridiales bacterium]|jgi:regulator of extracellular matrix RemA (YlzA/DUF370 family)|nr:DUF370 domain-containing protein [Clostridiales bacterium]
MSESRIINIGFGNIVFINRVIAIISNDSAPVKRMINQAVEQGMLVDATQGRRTRCVIVMDSGHVVLSALQPETVGNRVAKGTFEANVLNEDAQNSI